jgi:hypothetical protein
MRSRTLCILLLPLFAAACGGDEDRPAGQRTGAQADSAGMMGMPGEEMYTPEESAQAAHDVQRHTDSMRAAVLKASGGEPAAEDVPAPPPVLSVKERYEACIRQANAADEPVRARLAQACANIRNQPPR